VTVPIDGTRLHGTSRGFLLRDVEISYHEDVAKNAPHVKARKRVARNLREIIQEKRITRTELADASALSRNTISLIEHAQCGATIDTLGHLADTLVVDISRLTARPRRRRRKVVLLRPRR
jgi:DNA-binding Xre family transcriptional regulator